MIKKYGLKYKEKKESDEQINICNHCPCNKCSLALQGADSQWEPDPLANLIQWINGVWVADEKMDVDDLIRYIEKLRGGE